MDTPLESFVHKRALTILQKNGYKTYDDIKTLTFEDFRNGKITREYTYQEVYMGATQPRNVGGKIRNKITIQLQNIPKFMKPISHN